MDSDDPRIRVTCNLCRHGVMDPPGYMEADTYTCPHCGHVFNLDEDEDVTLTCEFLGYPDTVFWYLTPFLACRQCRELIELPYSNLTQTDEAGKLLLAGGNPPELPSEEWSATFGCRKCGHVAEYFYVEVEALPIPKYSEGTYQSGKGVYLARFPCGDRHCTTPVSMYVDTVDKNASEAVELLRSGVFDGKTMPCGHEMKTVPAKFYTVEPVMHRMW